MVWTTPTLVEICIGLEINGYLPAEFWYHLRDFLDRGGPPLISTVLSERRSAAPWNCVAN